MCQLLTKSITFCKYSIITLHGCFYKPRAEEVVLFHTDIYFVVFINLLFFPLDYDFFF